MNVLIVPAGDTGPVRALVPPLEDVFRTTSGGRVRVRPLRDTSPSRGGKSDRAGLADAVERYNGAVQVFVRCLTDDVYSTMAIAEAQDVLVRRRVFWGDDAWRNLGLWIREGFDPKEPNWRTGVRSELEDVVQDAKYGPAANLIDITSRAWLLRHDLPLDDEEEQRRLQAQIAPLIGSIHDESLQGENASEQVRAILAEKQGRSDAQR